LLFGVATFSGHLVLQMERADGSLSDLLEVCRTEYGTSIPPAFLLELLAQAAQALDFLALHRGSGLTQLEQSGLQHCDVKPRNLVVGGDRMKGGDFGLCGSTHQSPGGFRGTPPYAAPELYEGRPSRHTDQYALAVTYCELVAGSRMFHKADPDQSTLPELV